MKVGFIGTGAIGRPCSEPRREGHTVAAFDLRPAALAGAVQAGASAAASAAAAATASELVITMLPSSSHVELAYLGDGGVSEGVAPGVCASTCPRSTRACRAGSRRRCGKRGARFLDAPVSGGVPRADDGTLAIMVGGDARDFEEARPVLAAMGANVIHVGPVGSRRGGQALQQPDRRRRGGRGQRGVPDRRGLRRRSEGPHRRHLQVVGQHLGHGAHASRARASWARRPRAATTRRASPPT